MKVASEARVGDTLFHEDAIGEPLPGFKQSKSVVFAGLFPGDSNDFEKLQDSIEKLTLNDNSVTLQKESRYFEKYYQEIFLKNIELLIFSAALGQGWRVGFLGMLHMEVFRQRLEEVFFFFF